MNKPKFLSVSIIMILLISIFSVLYTAKAESFGNATIFEDKTLLPEEIYAAKFSLTENAAVSNISWYAGEDGYQGLMAAAIYSDSGGSINNLLGYTESVAIPSEMAWVTSSSITWEEPEYALNLTAGDYWLGVKTNIVCFISLHMTDEPENGFCNNESSGFPDFPSTFSPIYNDFSMAIFANYSSAEDITAPTYSSLSSSTTMAGSTCQFNSAWIDETGLATTGGYIFGTNNTGTPTNATWIAFGSNPNTTITIITLNSTVGAVIQWQVWANDTNNNWNSTGIQSLTTTATPYLTAKPRPSSAPTPSPAVIGPSPFGVGISTDFLWASLLSYDIIGFILGCWTYSMAQTFYVICLLIVGGLFYIKTHSLLYVSIIWILFGSLVIGLTGVAMTSPMIYFLIAFAIATALYKIFSHTT